MPRSTLRRGNLGRTTDEKHLAQLELHRELADRIKQYGYVQIRDGKYTTVGSALSAMDRSKSVLPLNDNQSSEV